LAHTDPIRDPGLGVDPLRTPVRSSDPPDDIGERNGERFGRERADHLAHGLRLAVRSAQRCSGDPVALAALLDEPIQLRDLVGLAWRESSRAIKRASGSGPVSRAR